MITCKCGALFPTPVKLPSSVVTRCPYCDPEYFDEVEALRAQVAALTKEVERYRSYPVIGFMSDLEAVTAERDALKAKLAASEASNAAKHKALEGLTRLLSELRPSLKLAQAQWDKLEVAHNAGCGALAILGGGE